MNVKPFFVFVFLFSFNGFCTTNSITNNITLNRDEMLYEISNRVFIVHYEKQYFENQPATVTAKSDGVEIVKVEPAQSQNSLSRRIMSYNGDRDENGKLKINVVVVYEQDRIRQDRQGTSDTKIARATIYEIVGGQRYWHRNYDFCVWYEPNIVGKNEIRYIKRIVSAK